MPRTEGLREPVTTARYLAGSRSALAVESDMAMLSEEYSTVPRRWILGQADVRDLVLVVLLRIAPEHHLHAGEQAVLVQPDLCVAGFEAQQAQLGIVLALEPGGDERIPQAFDRRIVGIDLILAVDVANRSWPFEAKWIRPSRLRPMARPGRCRPT
jgi:hypothetical protein